MDHATVLLEYFVFLRGSTTSTNLKFSEQELKPETKRSFF